MRPELKRRFDRLIWRDRVRRGLTLLVPAALVTALAGGGLWVRSHGGPPWIILPLAAVVAAGKPAFILLRYLNKRSQRNSDAP
jgi:hypothetical protein